MFEQDFFKCRALHGALLVADVTGNVDGGGDAGIEGDGNSGGGDGGPTAVRVVRSVKAKAVEVCWREVWVQLSLSQYPPAVQTRNAEPHPLSRK